MNNVFFGNEGITSTECNHRANVKKESIKHIQDVLNNITFITTSLESLNSDKRVAITYGTKDVDSIIPELEKIAKAHSYCAWSREALKAKDEMLKEVNDKSFETWCEENNVNLEYPESDYSSFKNYRPSDVFKTWSAEKQEKYFTLEAIASTIGKYIHPDGPFSKARNKLIDSVTHPCDVRHEPETTIYHYTRSVTVEEVDRVFMELQAKHREAESALNQLKAELQEETNKLNIKVNAENDKAVDEYQKKLQDYHSQLQLAKNQFNKWKISELEKISSLKIIIPETLTD